MLVEQNLISGQDAYRLAQAIIELDEPKIRASRYTGEFEDLFFHVEHLISESAGEAAGNLHIARSRNDLGVAMYRMVLRGGFCGPRGRCSTCRMSCSRSPRSTWRP